MVRLTDVRRRRASAHADADDLAVRDHARTGTDAEALARIVRAAIHRSEHVVLATLGVHQQRRYIARRVLRRGSWAGSGGRPPDADLELGAALRTFPVGLAVRSVRERHRHRVAARAIGSGVNHLPAVAAEIAVRIVVPVEIDAVGETVVEDVLPAVDAH